MLIIKFKMLKVKHLTLFTPKNWKNVGIFTKVARKIDIFGNLVSRFSLSLTKICFSIECKWFEGTNLNINGVMTSP